MFLEYLKISFLMIRARPVRSALSWLGIYIGVLALIIILAIHEGTRRELENLYRTEGARIVLVHPGFDRVSKTIGKLGMADLARLESTRGVSSVLPRLQDERDVRSVKAATHAQVAGIDENFCSIYRVPVLRGRVFLAREVATKQPVCLLTQETAQTLFPFSEALNSTVDIGGSVFRIVGVIAWSPEISQRAFMQDPQILVPTPWLFKKDMSFIPTMEVRVRPDVSADQATNLVTQTLTHGDAARANLYSIMTFEKFFEKRKAMSDRTLYSLLAIAAVSLLVGGIGIANVMLTSVTERTREVGIRKALGATRKDILFQFLVESSVLCASGGFAAVLTGWIGVSILISFLPDKFPAAIPPIPMAVCLAMTLLIGLIAGLYPASRAASLSPAEALRYE